MLCHLQYPHFVRKAQPVTKLMVRDVLDSVDAVQLPPPQLQDGPWLQQVRLDRLRLVLWMLLLVEFGRRAGRQLC